MVRGVIVDQLRVTLELYILVDIGRASVHLLLAPRSLLALLRPVMLLLELQLLILIGW